MDERVLLALASEEIPEHALVEAQDLVQVPEHLLDEVGALVFWDGV